jgi:hypothetical protein
MGAQSLGLPRAASTQSRRDVTSKQPQGGLQRALHRLSMGGRMFGRHLGLAHAQERQSWAHQRDCKCGVAGEDADLHGARHAQRLRQPRQQRSLWEKWSWDAVANATCKKHNVGHEDIMTQLLFYAVYKCSCRPQDAAGICSTCCQTKRKTAAESSLHATPLLPAARPASAAAVLSSGEKEHCMRIRTCKQM